MFKLFCVLVALLVCGSVVFAQTASDITGANPPANGIWVDSLDLSKISQGWSTPKVGKSLDGNPMTLKGVVYKHGVGTHANGEMIINLKKTAVKFVSMVGVDDESKTSGSVVYQVYVDGKKMADTGVLRGGGEPQLISVDLTGAKKLDLIVTDADGDISWDHADWAGAVIILAANAKAKPEMMKIPVEPAIPIASTDNKKLGIHGARVVGGTPGRWFQFLIPATGEGTLTYSATGLPEGLALDSATGIISGSIKNAGEWIVELSVKDVKGTAKRKVKIIGGEHKLAQTPPMGWNSWNVWACAVDDAKVRAAADAMVNSGLAAHGFTNINIDDCWEGPERASNGEITTNNKFPDMKALSDYVHSKGLKLGIYSGPGPKTCGGYIATWQHEQQDANTWAKWGIDYLKYDWCSYGDVATGEGLERLQKPYKVMRDALDNCGRDVVFSFCQYGMGDVWEWGEKIGGNCWRTTGDINDSWGSLSNIAFNQNGHEKFAGPGHWNDPDMLVVGKVGWGPSLHPSNLTPNEQVLHITMWSLLSSPLLIGCNMADMDQFTINLLTNDEVLDINQDPLGKPAGRKSQDGMAEVWARPLWDGTVAVGLFNRSSMSSKVTAKWSDLGITGSQPVRDLWQKKNLGKFKDSYTTSVPAHGAILIKVGRPDRQL